MHGDRDVTTSCWDAGIRRDLTSMAAYLARRDLDAVTSTVVQRTDAVVLCGSAVLQALDTAVAALITQSVPRLLITGGVGHSTELLRDAVRRHPRYRDVATDSRTEAAILADILQRHHRVPAAVISIEQDATNCGENARLALALLHRQQPPPVRSILLIQDPLMQRRTHASFQFHLRKTPGVSLLSFAPFVPLDATGVTDAGAVWTRERFVSLVLGEMRRLRDDEHGYGPEGRGFIDHIDIPAPVLDAYQRVAAQAPDLVRGTCRF